jgi:anti-anti-sigma factor
LAVTSKLLKGADLMKRRRVSTNVTIRSDECDKDRADRSRDGSTSMPVERMHTLVLTGELDPASTHTLVTEIAHRCRDGATGITLDLGRLTYIDPTGVAAVLFMSRWCEKRGYDFALIPGSWLIQRSFELAGLIDRLPFKDTTRMENALDPRGPRRIGSRD